MSKIKEGRDAPLYHWISVDKLAFLIKRDVLLGNWEHKNPETGKTIMGTSLSRNKRFRWAGRNVRIVFDQARLARDYKILPLDANLVAYYTALGLKGDNWKKNNFNRSKVDAKGNWSLDFGEEFILGDIKNAHKYIMRIDFTREGLGKLARVFGKIGLKKDIRQYIDNYNIPVRFIPPVDSTQHMRMRENRLDDLEHDKELKKTGFWGAAGSGVLPMAMDTGRLLLPFRSSVVEQPHTWGGTWGGAIDKGQNPKESAIREFREESGYQGPISMIPLYVFKDQNTGFRYFNYLGIVSRQFEPSLDWETDDYAWVEYGDWPTPMHFGLKGILSNQQSVNIIESILRNLENGRAQESVDWEIDDIRRLAGITETEYSSVSNMPVKELAAFYNVKTGKLVGGYLMTHADLIVDHAELFGVDPSIKNRSSSDIGMMLDNKYRQFHEDGWVRFLIMRDGRTIILGINGFAKHIGMAWKQKMIPQLIMKSDPDEVMVDLEPEGSKSFGDALFDLPSNVRRMKAWFEKL